MITNETYWTCLLFNSCNEKSVSFRRVLLQSLFSILAERWTEHAQLDTLITILCKISSGWRSDKIISTDWRRSWLANRGPPSHWTMLHQLFSRPQPMILEKRQKEDCSVSLSREKTSKFSYLQTFVPGLLHWLTHTHTFFRVLLQRISAILTEPARDTVKEYDAMKKLIVPKNQGKPAV